MAPLILDPCQVGLSPHAFKSANFLAPKIRYPTYSFLLTIEKIIPRGHSFTTTINGDITKQ